MIPAYDSKAFDAVSSNYARSIVTVELASALARKAGIAVVSSSGATGARVREAHLLGELLGLNAAVAVVEASALEGGDLAEFAMHFQVLDELPAAATLEDLKTTGYLLELATLRPQAVATPPAPPPPAPSSTVIEGHASADTVGPGESLTGVSIDTVSAEGATGVETNVRTPATPDVGDPAPATDESSAPPDSSSANG